MGHYISHHGHLYKCGWNIHYGGIMGKDFHGTLNYAFPWLLYGRFLRKRSKDGQHFTWLLNHPMSFPKMFSKQISRIIQLVWFGLLHIKIGSTGWSTQFLYMPHLHNALSVETVNQLALFIEDFTGKNPLVFLCTKKDLIVSTAQEKGPPANLNLFFYLLRVSDDIIARFSWVMMSSLVSSSSSPFYFFICPTP